MPYWQKEFIFQSAALAVFRSLGGQMQNEVDPKLKVRIHIPDSLAVKEMRRMRQLTMKEAALLINASVATIKRKENKSYTLKKGELDNFMEAYGFSKSDLLDIKLSKNIKLEDLKCPTKVKIIEVNRLRRSYKKIISKEVEAITQLRKRRGINIKEACTLCNYDRCAIGSIENGRITLTDTKIKHIVSSYGFKMKSFLAIINSQIDRFEIENNCITNIKNLTDEKLMTLQSLLKNY